MRRTGSLYTAPSSLKLLRCSLWECVRCCVHHANKQRHCAPTKVMTTHRSSHRQGSPTHTTHAHVHMCKHVHVRVHIHTYMCKHTLIYAHPHTRTRTHTQWAPSILVHTSYHDTSSALACQWYTWRNPYTYINTYHCTAALYSWYVSHSITNADKNNYVPVIGV